MRGSTHIAGADCVLKVESDDKSVYELRLSGWQSSLKCEKREPFVRHLPVGPVPVSVAIL